MVYSKGNDKRKVYSSKHLYLKRTIPHINNITAHLKKKLEKEEQTKPKASRRKEIIRIRVDKIKKRIEKQ